MPKWKKATAEAGHHDGRRRRHATSSRTSRMQARPGGTAAFGERASSRAAGSRQTAAAESCRARARPRRQLRNGEPRARKTGGEPDTERQCGQHQGQRFAQQDASDPGQQRAGRALHLGFSSTLPPAPRPSPEVDLGRRLGVLLGTQRAGWRGDVHISPRTTGISRSRIFLRSVLRLSPSIAAALIWLPRVAARVRRISGRSTSAITRS